jgi:diguanylate cyclase (GGDEF)-like protein/putative nucleotidyltransferase with HDIG domain/PAS domain S-box-containing protein
MSLLATRLVNDDVSVNPRRLSTGSILDSSRSLLSLFAISRIAQADHRRGPGEWNLNGIISRRVLRSLITALQFRDPATVQHGRRVAHLALGLAQQLGWEGRHLQLLEVAALLHDIGKIGVPDNILFKPAKLSPDEIDLMALHYSVGFDVLQACFVDHEVLQIVAQSQNSLSRAGDGFKNTHIGARILAVADAYESLNSEHVYRKAKSHDEILQILTDASGTQFDGNIVQALSRRVQQTGSAFSGEYQDSSILGGPSGPHEAREADSLCRIFSHLYLLESLYDGFLIVDAEQQVITWNHGLEQLTGRVADERLGRPWTPDMLKYAGQDGRPLALADCPLAQAQETGAPVSIAAQIPRADGRSLQVEIQAIPLIDERGHWHGAVEIIRDFTRSGGKRPQEFRELQLAASRDPLTAVANRGELETQLLAMVKNHHDDPDQSGSVIFLDVDFFKQINDTHGHAVGDKVLVELARLLQHETYSGEVVGRYGGEEFVILCPGTDQEAAVRRAERLRTAISRMKFPREPNLKLTASFGVTPIEPGDSVESVLRRADKALYLSKEQGRNQTTVVTSESLKESRSSAVRDGGQSPFMLQNTFAAVTAADTIIYKLGGFVNDHHGAILNVTPQRVTIRLGSSGWLPFWGSTRKRQPVRVDLGLGEKVQAAGGRGTPRVNIHTTITPEGWIRDREVFLDRAHQVLRELKGYFAAE